MMFESWSIDYTRLEHEGYFLELPEEYIRNKKNLHYELHQIMFKVIKNKIDNVLSKSFLRVQVDKYNDYMLLYKLGPKPKLY